MWRCDPPTRVVLAALAGLGAAAFGMPLAALAVAIPMGPRVPVALTASVAAWWGSKQVEELRHRALPAGPVTTLVVVTEPPSGDRAMARVPAAEEDVLLVSRAIRPQLGGVYLVEGYLAEPSAQVRDYYATQGVHLELQAEELRLIGRRGGAWGVVDRLHAVALQRLGADRDPTPARALVAGVTLGETGALPADVKQQFRDSGLYHIVAVSGQNVALVVLFTLVCLAVMGVIGPPARITAICLTVAYVLVTGAGPSIVRAGVAGVLTCVAWLASRPVARWHLLGCGAVLVLALNPLDLFAPGFQMSFAAVAAIFVVAPRLRGWVGQATAISIACSVATAPISWWHFQQIAPLSVPANLLALPAVAPLLVSGLASILLGTIGEPLAAPPLALADMLAGYLLWVAELCS
jgi:competence protein ComEC